MRFTLDFLHRGNTTITGWMSPGLLSSTHAFPDLSWVILGLFEDVIITLEVIHS